jgi:TonB family protein
MIAFIVEVIAFQLIFMLGYDLFLKGETFFNWNRAYLLGTFTISFVLPFIKIDLLRKVIPPGATWKVFSLQNLNGVTVSASAQQGITADIPWLLLIFLAGVIISLLYFIRKLRIIRQLKARGVVQEFTDFTKIIVANSSIAFSFFRNLFIGDRIKGFAQQQIIAHERVHISEYHSLDLLYFEIMRVVQWFNPMVYLYQMRVSELHEFIADSQVPIEGRANQVNLMLSHIFDTHKISFINQFFQSSLIKKRIVMLKKTKSHKVWKFKYLLLIPLMALMLCYSACKDESPDIADRAMQVADVENLTAQEERELYQNLRALSNSKNQWTFTVSDGTSSLQFMEGTGTSYISGPNGEQISARLVIDGETTDNFGSSLFKAIEPISFGEVEEVPIFPGCEGLESTKDCFNQQLQKHIMKNFRYPDDAIKQGIEGRVNLMFTIDKNGKVGEVRSRGPHSILESEAERIILRLPDMLPGREHDKAVKVYYSIPITFQLD